MNYSFRDFLGQHHDSGTGHGLKYLDKAPKVTGWWGSGGGPKSAGSYRNFHLWAHTHRSNIEKKNLTFALCLADDVRFCSFFLCSTGPGNEHLLFSSKCDRDKWSSDEGANPSLEVAVRHQIGKANKDSQRCAQLQLRCSEDFHHRPVLVLWAGPRWSMMALGLWQISMMSFKVFWEILCRLT